MKSDSIIVRQARTAADRKAFVDLAWTLYADDPNWVPPLRSEVLGLIGGIRTNPWFEHADAALFIAERGGRAVGRISAQVDRLVQEHMGPGTGQFGFFDCIDDASVSAALFDAAETWLKARSMTRALGPFSLSIWDEPGLLIKGSDHPPMVMMGHHRSYFARLIEARGYTTARDLFTYELPIAHGFNEKVNRIVAMAEANDRIRIRKVDKSRFDAEAALILDILNDAWSENWGFIPLTPREIEYVGKKLKPIVFEDLIRIAELDGEPVAFMMTLLNINELTRDLNGRLLPFGWAKLLWRLHRPRVQTLRVPLMGVRRNLQGSRVASLMAFLLIEYIRRAGHGNYGATRGEIGWILDDNTPMKSIADVIESRVNKVYRIYERPL